MGERRGTILESALVVGDEDEVKVSNMRRSSYEHGGDRNEENGRVKGENGGCVPTPLFQLAVNSDDMNNSSNGASSDEHSSDSSSNENHRG